MDTRDRPRQQFVPLGYISGVHGIAGGVKIHSYTRPRASILDYVTWRLGESRTPVRVEHGGPQGKTLVAMLTGVDDREKARALIGKEIAVLRSELPSLERGEYYWADLVGLMVSTRQGTLLGRVERLLETGANDVLVIRGEREHLVPYVPGQYVFDIDLQAGTMVVDWDPDF